MRVLLILIFNKNDIYNNMLEIQRSYIHNNLNIDTYFVSFDETILEDVKIVDDIIYVKGNESYINILYKTLKSFNHIINKLDKKYDFIIRSNVSTIIHFDNLLNYLNKIPSSNIYIGGHLETLKWQLTPYEISENKQDKRNDYYGLKYIQGIGIILSYDIVMKLLDISSSIEYDIVDDVKFGLLIREYMKETYENIDKLPLAKVSYGQLETDSIFIRNRTLNRLFDVYSMRNIVNNLYNIQYSNYDKIIHIAYKTIDKLENIKKQWLELNPNYKVELYDDEKCLFFLNKHYGKKYCDIFNFIQDGAIKCDFFRLCLLYICGGIYVDADIKPLISLNEYIDDDVDFATCVSYNYVTTKLTFQYNPHFIVTKKYNSFIYETIKKYEEYYDKNEYSYWEWSICKLLNINIQFNMNNLKNIFIINGKKYQFLVENVLNNNMWYDFTNIFNENGLFKIDYCWEAVCRYNGIDVFENFTNKNLLE